MYLPEPNNSEFTPPPSGTHPARCYRVIDKGTQASDYQGDIKYLRKVLLSWELDIEERMDDGRRFSVHQTYTFSTHEKAKLRQHLESWRGKKFEESDFGPGGFDIRKLIGVPCLVSLVHQERNGRTYANISGVMPPYKGMEISGLTTDTTFFSLDEFDEEIYNSLSDGLKETIAKSPEYIKLMNPEGDPVHDEQNPPPAGDYDPFGIDG